MGNKTAIKQVFGSVRYRELFTEIEKFMSTYKCPNDRIVTVCKMFAKAVSKFEFLSVILEFLLFF